MSFKIGAAFRALHSLYSKVPAPKMRAVRHLHTETSFDQLLATAHSLAREGKREEFYLAADRIIAKALDPEELKKLQEVAEKLTDHARKLEATPLERVLAADLQDKVFVIELSALKQPKK